jgi:hypothetical protein
VTTKDNKTINIDPSGLGCGCFIVLFGLALFSAPLIAVINAIKS